MLIPTSQPTAEDIIQADLERVEYARWAALRESYADYARVVDFKTFCRWERAVNRRFMKMLKRLN